MGVETLMQPTMTSS